MFHHSLFQKKISIPLWMVFFLLFLAYFFWEIYWFQKVGLNFVKWHTHFVPLFALWYIISFGISFTSFQKEIQLGIASLFFSLLMAEFTLMIIGYNKTYIENRSGNYQSLLNENQINILRNYSPNSTHELSSPEFNYKRKTNREGFSDNDFEFKGSNILIQTYGDSFTEGDGAPADSSYPENLKRLLGNGYLIQNFGICGNDPGFYLKQFEKVGTIYEPDVIVLSYGTGDFVVDFFSRGGLERFNQKVIKANKSPWWEVIYATSYVSRLFFHASGFQYNSFFMKESERISRLKNLESKWNALFTEIARQAEIHHTKILLFKKPERSEIVANKYEYDMSFFDQFLKNNPNFHHIDLLPFYRSQGLIDQTTTSSFYWPMDGHHNSKGYEVMAKGVYIGIQAILKNANEPLQVHMP